METRPKKRGRPRAYDPVVALRRATNLFWDRGFSAASLDELGVAMGMNRPSIYGAFGDKQELYLASIRAYVDAHRREMERIVSGERPLLDELRALYEGAIALYTAGPHGARGCLLLGTAATEAVCNAGVRDALAWGLRSFEEVVMTRLHLAAERGELRKGARPTELALVANGVLNALAMRARAGSSRAALDALVAAALGLIAPHVRASRAKTGAPRGPAKSRRPRASSPAPPPART